MPLTFDDPEIVFDITKGTILEASAGSGKTTILTERWIVSFLYLLIWEKKSISESLSSIVALTFTRKAATEMKIRIRERMDELWQEDELTHMIQNLEKFAGTCPLTIEEILEKNWKFQMDDLLSGIKVLTINSYVLQSLRQNSLELENDIGFNPEDEGQNFSLIEQEGQTETFHRLLLNYGKDSVEQHCFERAIMLCGLSKWQTLFTQIRKLVHNFGKDAINKSIAETGYLKYQTKLLQASSNQEFMEIVADILMPQVSKMIKTLDQEAAYKKLTSDNVNFYVNLYTINQNNIINLFYKNIIGQYKYTNVKNLEQDQLRQESRDQYLKLVDTLYYVIIPLMLPVSDLCSQIVREKQNIFGEITFGESEILFAELLQDSSFKQKIQSRIRFFFADEYQDTSDIQKSIFDSIVQQSNIIPFFVGDPKQSIYRFRKANVYVFHKTIKEFQEQEHSVKYLNTNYRSAESHVDFVNYIFRNVFENDPSGIEYKDQNAKKEDQGAFSYTLAKMFDEDGSKNNTDARMEQAYYDALSMIQNYLDQGVNPGEIMVLFRETKHILQFYQLIQEYAPNLPVSSSTRNILWEHQTVVPLLNFLRVISRPYHDLTMVALLKTPFFMKTDIEISEYLLKAKELKVSVLDVLPQNERKIIDKFLLLRDRVSLEELISELIHDTNYEEIFTSGSDRATLRLFMEESESLQQKRSMSLNEFISFIDNKIPKADEAEFSDEENSTLRIMTIHSSKGLESPYVIYVHKSKSREQAGRFPQYIHEKVAFDTLGKGMITTEIEEITKIEENSEEKRLIYVALTRAKKEFVFCALPMYNEKYIGCESFLHQELIESHPKYALCVQKNASLIEGQIVNENIEDLSAYKNRLEELKQKDQQFIRKEIPQFLSVSLLLDAEFDTDRFHQKYKMKSFNIMESLQQITDAEDRFSLNLIDLGSILHELFQQFDAPQKEEVLNYLTKHYAHYEDQFPLILDYAYTYWESEFYQTMIQKSVFQEKERQVLGLINDKIMIRATADLYVAGEKNIIVDYKLSVQEKNKDRYHRQLSYYALLSEHAGYSVDELVLFSLKDAKVYSLEWNREETQKAFDSAVETVLSIL